MLVGETLMAKKEFRNPGKGMRPTMGYNHRKWNKNFDEIDWGGDKVLSVEQVAAMKKQLSKDIPNNLKFPTDLKLNSKK